MRAEGGKKHGRFWIGDGTLDTATTPSLSQLRAQSTSSGPGIRPRPEPTRIAMNEMQAQLDEERRLRHELERSFEERMAAERSQWLQTLAAERSQWYAMMTPLYAAMGQTPPPMPTPSRPLAPQAPNTPYPSEGSNTPGAGGSHFGTPPHFG
ncbi:uncharacterized protein LOC133923494 isoform X1 [Phragmites australis]|uniref:uncharacterized protein LOC133923494 isoform X1 n=2 Tax=Phragmites australis TaxID=29695 RepID=UPI002D7950AA|nr:uncharacterized protein LOC133923494 isoform X1 [Phragmites australis]